ncbi:hypothetical protein EON66_01575 [archaeon]|nr:MAG: hypothetical protein EON66_01575 [archaeon]
MEVVLPPAPQTCLVPCLLLLRCMPPHILPVRAGAMSLDGPGGGMITERQLDALAQMRADLACPWWYGAARARLARRLSRNVCVCVCLWVNEPPHVRRAPSRC